MPFFNHWYILLLILIIVLIVYGPGKLPEVGGAIGKAMREFRRASSDLTDEIRKGTTLESTPNPPPATSSNAPAATDRPATDPKPATDAKPTTETKA